MINPNSSKHSRIRGKAVSSVIPACMKINVSPTIFCSLVNVALESCSHRPSTFPTSGLVERSSVKLFNCSTDRFSVKHSSQVIGYGIVSLSKLLLMLLLLIIQLKLSPFL